MHEIDDVTDNVYHRFSNTLGLFVVYFPHAQNVAHLFRTLSISSLTPDSVGSVQLISITAIL